MELRYMAAGRPQERNAMTTAKALFILIGSGTVCPRISCLRHKTNRSKPKIVNFVANVLDDWARIYIIAMREMSDDDLLSFDSVLLNDDGIVWQCQEFSIRVNTILFRSLALSHLGQS